MNGTVTAKTKIFFILLLQSPNSSLMKIISYIMAKILGAINDN